MQTKNVPSENGSHARGIMSMGLCIRLLMAVWKFGGGV